MKNRCILCGRGCTPMADYDVTVCYRCDDRMEVILAIGPMPQARPAPRIPSDLFDQLRAQVGAA